MLTETTIPTETTVSLPVPATETIPASAFAAAITMTGDRTDTQYALDCVQITRAKAGPIIMDATNGHVAARITLSASDDDAPALAPVLIPDATIKAALKHAPRGKRAIDAPVVLTADEATGAPTLRHGDGTITAPARQEAQFPPLDRVIVAASADTVTLRLGAPVLAALAAFAAKFDANREPSITLHLPLAGDDTGAITRAIRAEVTGADGARAELAIMPMRPRA